MIEKAKCPFCKHQITTDKKWITCNLCGNGFSTEKNEVTS